MSATGPPRSICMRAHKKEKISEGWEKKALQTLILFSFPHSRGVKERMRFIHEKGGGEGTSHNRAELEKLTDSCGGHGASKGASCPRRFRIVNHAVGNWSPSGPVSVYSALLPLCRPAHHVGVPSVCHRRANHWPRSIVGNRCAGSADGGGCEASERSRCEPGGRLVVGAGDGPRVLAAPDDRRGDRAAADGCLRGFSGVLSPIKNPAAA